MATARGLKGIVKVSNREKMLTFLARNDSDWSFFAVGSPLSDVRKNSFMIAQWPEGFFVQQAKTGTVTWEQLVAMLFPLNKL